ncbi:MAG: hypothetical protein ACREEB_07630 [Caulobacteraceae bacterium]
MTNRTDMWAHFIRAAVVGLSLAAVGCNPKDYPPRSYREARGTAACKTNCAGHEAGWRWADGHRIADPSMCGGRSESFREGCIAYAEDVGKSKWVVLNAVPSTREVLSDCTPFTSLDGRSMLWFRPDKGLVAVGNVQNAEDQLTLMMDLSNSVDSVAAGKAVPSPATRAAVVSVGSFDVDEPSRSVTLRLATGERQYSLITPKPVEENGCVLVYGELTAADLSQSWFGSPPDQGQLDGPSDPDE